MKKLLAIALLLVGCAKEKSATVTAVDGKDGLNGKDGNSCSVVRESANFFDTKVTRDALHISCTDGTDLFINLNSDFYYIPGLPGANGLNALIEQRQANESECKDKGIIITTALDLNSNGVIDQGDTNFQQSTLCNVVSYIKQDDSSDDSGSGDEVSDDNGSDNEDNSDDNGSDNTPSEDKSGNNNDNQGEDNSNNYPPTPIIFPPVMPLDCTNPVIKEMNDICKPEKPESSGSNHNESAG